MIGMITTISYADANAGTEQTVTSGETVQLDGTASIPEHSDGTLRYRWRQTHKRTSPCVRLHHKRKAIATFIAPEVEEATELTFKLKTVERYDCTKRQKKGSFGIFNHSYNQHAFRHGRCHKRFKRCKKYVSFDTVSVFVLPADDNNNTDNNDTNISGVTITGQVADTNGTPIPNATVSTSDQNVTTDSNGNYTLVNIADTERLTVNVTHPDYLANSRITEVNGRDISLDIVLSTPKASSSFDTAEGTTLASSDGASVKLPAGGYVDENGNPYTGTAVVKMSYYAITTQSGRETFPGTFEGRDANGTTYPITSYGFMNVELTDANGNPINLDGNATATLTFPEDRNVYSPTVIPLWYYDKTLGYWVQEGEAVRDGNTYVGTVKHFTSWNLDAKGPRATFRGCVEDENGTHISNALVQFRATNWDSYTLPTDENGTISVYNVLAETELTFSAYTKIGSTYYYGDKSIYLNEGENRIDNSCVVLTPQHDLPGMITVTGTLINYTDTPVANTTFHIYAGNHYPYQVIATGTTDTNGSFSITFETVDQLQYSVGGDYPVKTFTLQEHKTLYDLGTFNIFGEAY
jgi:hypothetical protein